MSDKDFNILLVDDHPLIIAGIKSVINSLPHFNVIGEAKNGMEGLEVFNEYKPDIIVLDIDMPIMNGIELASTISKIEDPPKIVFLTSHADMNTFSQATKIDYAGFVFKENALEEIGKCLEEIINDNKYVSPSFKRYIEENESEIAKLSEIKKNLTALTKSEVKVLKLIAEGKTTPEIAETLFNSFKTIENHRYNICQKLNITGSNNLLSFALDYKELVFDL